MIVGSGSVTGHGREAVMYSVKHAPHFVLQLKTVAAVGHAQSKLISLATTQFTAGVKQSRTKSGGHAEPIVSVTVGQAGVVVVGDTTFVVEVTGGGEKGHGS